MTLTKLAPIAGTSRSALRDRLLACGVKMRPKGRRPGSGRPKALSRREQLTVLREALEGLLTAPGPEALERARLALQVTALVLLLAFLPQPAAARGHGLSARSRPTAVVSTKTSTLRTGTSELCEHCHGSPRYGCRLCRRVVGTVDSKGRPTCGVVSLLGPCKHCDREAAK